MTCEEPPTPRHVFVSSQAVDRYPAAHLIARLKELGVEVEHSPSNPAHKPDARWSDWYGSALQATLRRCGVFVVVVDAGWDSSSWMAEEAHFALEATGMDRHLRGYFWNPERLRVTAAGVAGYLREELPLDVDDAARLVAHEASGRTNRPLSTAAEE